MKNNLGGFSARCQNSGGFRLA